MDKINNVCTSLSFGFHKEDPSKSSVIINDGKEIPLSIQGGCGAGPPNISVNKIKALDACEKLSGKGSLFCLAL